MFVACSPSDSIVPLFLKKRKKAELDLVNRPGTWEAGRRGRLHVQGRSRLLVELQACLDYRTEPCFKNKNETETHRKSIFLVTYICIYAYMCTCIHICVHTYIYACVHTYMYTFILLLATSHTSQLEESLSESFLWLVLYHFYTVQRISSNAWFKDLIHLRPPHPPPSQTLGPSAVRKSLLFFLITHCRAPVSWS